MTDNPGNPPDDMQNGYDKARLIRTFLHWAGNNGDWRLGREVSAATPFASETWTQALGDKQLELLLTRFFRTGAHRRPFLPNQRNGGCT